MKNIFHTQLMVQGLMNFATGQNPQWQTYTTGDRVQAQAEEGNVLCAGTTAGLVEIDKNSGETTFYDALNSGLPKNEISVIAVDEEGSKWIGPWDGGLTKYDGSKWTTFNASNSYIPNDWVNTIAMDENGSKWMGTFVGGTGVYNENRIPVSVHENSVLANEINIFPNPFIENIYIESLAKAQINSSRIFDLKGNITKAQNVEATEITIHLGFLPSGIYLIKVIADKGTETHQLIIR